MLSLTPLRMQTLSAPTRFSGHPKPPKRTPEEELEVLDAVIQKARIAASPPILNAIEHLSLALEAAEALPSEQREHVVANQVEHLRQAIIQQIGAPRFKALYTDILRSVEE